MNETVRHLSHSRRGLPISSGITLPPCVVVSSDDVLSVDVWQTHVVPITSNVGRAGIAGNVLLPTKASGLPKDSVAVALGLELIDRSLLGKQAGRLPGVLIDDIDEGLRAVLGI